MTPWASPSTDEMGETWPVIPRNGRGKGSGVRVDGPSGAVFDFRDGKISRIRLFLDHDEALRAAGLAE
jgi:ketosteroid isomerase-like protein